MIVDSPLHHLSARRLLLSLMATGLAAVDGASAVRAALIAEPVGHPPWLCAIGKAAQSMTLGVCDALPGPPVGGLLITKHAHADPVQLKALGITTYIGGHPLPDAGSLSAGRALKAALARLPADTKLLMLISGGASSLVETPIEGIGLAQLQRVNRWLLASALPIGDMNLVRKSLSRIKAGGLLEIIGDRPIRALAISDVPGDAPDVIGSGLLVPEPMLAERVSRLELPGWLADWVARGLRERGIPPTTGPEIELVATLNTAKAAVTAAARRSGLGVQLHQDFIAGDAALCGRLLARTLIEGAPGLHVWGGETTVRLPDTPGRGGRNQHLALAAAIELDGQQDCLLLSVGTDGTDGPTEDAGALVDGNTLARAALAGFDAHAQLARANAGQVLEASGDLIRTGPTGTNVMDLILGLKR